MQGERGVAAAVIELDPLPDAVGTAAEHENALLAGGGFPDGLARRGIVGGVEVRGNGLELTGARIHGAVERLEPEGAARFAHLLLGGAREVRDLAVGEAPGFGLAQGLRLFRGEGAGSDG